MNVVILAAILIHYNGVFVEAILDKVTQCNHVEEIKNIANIDDYFALEKFNISEDSLLDFNGLVKKYLSSHSIKEYDVFTKDGYTLKLFHIPGDKDKAVLVSHGLLASADDFILRGKKSLIYMLANEDFDVWAINYRGNRYSRRHTTLLPELPTFWDYSLQEYGYYDLAAVIDFIYKMNDCRPLSIVGHSEGSAAPFVLLSQKPKYNCQIKVFIAMAPACYIANSGSAVLKAFVKLGKVFMDILAAFGIHEILGHNSVSTKILTLLCTQGYAGHKLCVDGLFGSWSGYEDNNIEEGSLCTIMGHNPAGTSRKNLMHFIQIGQSDKFANFDYGHLNQVKYGSDLPPEYDFNNVTCKVALVAAKNDQTITIKDVKRLIDMLPNVVSYHEVCFEEFTHLDYIWGRNAYEVLYPHVIKVLNKYW